MVHEDADVPLYVLPKDSLCLLVFCMVVDVPIQLRGHASHLQGVSWYGR